MTSNPTTPVTSRKFGLYGSSGNLPAAGSGLEATTTTTKIPILSRNGSVRRMRNSQSFSNDHHHPHSPGSFTTSSTLPFTIRENSKSSSFLDQHQELPAHLRSGIDFLTPSTRAKMQKANHVALSGGESNGIPNGHVKRHQHPQQLQLNNNNLAKHDRSMSLNLAGPRNTRQARSPRTPQTPKSPYGATRTSSTPQTPPVTPDYPNGYIEDDDLDSLRSYSSAASVMSCDYHSPVPRNGTTFSGRRLKYVVHCSQYAGQTGLDYLTPTQRAQRHIRRLRELLAQARADLEQKDSEILKLTKEVVELRLFKASLSSPEERSNSSDAVTVKENTVNDACNSSNDVSPIVDMVDESAIKPSPRHHLHNPTITTIQLIDKMGSSEMHSSFADSGHFEDLSSVHSKESFIQTKDQATGIDGATIDEDRQALIEMYERKIEELIKQHDADKQDLQSVHNDKVEVLLQKLAECNSRFADLMPDYDQAKERIRELEKHLDDLQKQLQEQEDKANKMYLHMYTKGQEAERITHSSKVLDFARQAPNRVSVPELMHQLQVTQNELDNLRDDNFEPEVEGASSLLSAKEAISLWLLGARKQMYNRLIDAQQNKNRVDPEVKLQFLRSAVYYFLTDKENSQGHLNAIESILGFSEAEKAHIAKVRASK